MKWPWVYWSFISQKGAFYVLKYLDAYVLHNFMTTITTYSVQADCIWIIRVITFSQAQMKLSSDHSNSKLIMYIYKQTKPSVSDYVNSKENTAVL